MNHVGGRDHHPREFRASEPRVYRKLTQVLRSGTPQASYHPVRLPVHQRGVSPSSYRHAQQCPFVVDAERRCRPCSARSRVQFRWKAECLLPRAVRRCQDLGSHQRGRYVLIFVFALLYTNSRAQSTLCSRSRSYKRSSKSYEITSECCQLQTSGIISTLSIRQVSPRFTADQVI